MVTANLVCTTPSRISAIAASRPMHNCQSFTRRELLPLQPNQLWCIQLGFVRILTFAEDGTTITLGFGRSGDILGQPLACLHSYHVECLTRVEAYPLRNSHQTPDILVSDCQQNYAKQAQELLCILHCRGMEFRLIKLLSWLGREFGSDVPQGRLIHPRLTHQDMAEMISATRVTVSRLLSQLERQGKISWLKRGCVLQNGFGSRSPG